MPADASGPGEAGRARDPAALDEVRERALRLLARREHGVKELGDKLMRRAGTHPEDVREVVQELADRELVSDRRFAESFARDAIRLKPRARRLLVGELAARGVPPPVAGRAVDAVFDEEEVDDAELARRIAAAYLPRIAGRPDAARWRRLAGHLQRRGYDNERIYEICSSLLPEVDAGAD